MLLSHSLYICQAYQPNNFVNILPFIYSHSEVKVLNINGVTVYYLFNAADGIIVLVYSN